MTIESIIGLILFAGICYGVYRYIHRDTSKKTGSGSRKKRPPTKTRK